MSVMAVLDLLAEGNVPSPAGEVDPWTWLVPLPVTLPLIGAGLTLVAVRKEKVQRIITICVFVSVLLASFVMLQRADMYGPQVMQAAGWAAPMGVTLIVDRLAALMVLVSTIVTFAVMMYSIGQGRSSADMGDGEAPLPIFHPTLLVLAAGVGTTFISGDLFHIYVGFEMLLVASFVLLTLGGTEERVRAGVNYVFVNLLSSLFFLAAIAFVYAAAGTVNLAQLAVRLPELSSAGTLTLSALLLIGFGIKAALFPMMGWLPDSYPTAPAPVTAVFAGLLTKVGVYAMLRTQTLLFPDGRLNGMLMWAALLTMLFGILGAIAQDDIKRLLSFTLISHIGYLVFGLAVGNQMGLSASVFYMCHHIVVQTSLFLVTGLIEHRAGTTSLAELGGLARTAPLIAVLFFIPAINLGGIPPFSGWLGKIGLLHAGAQAGGVVAYALMAGAVVTSLLTLYAVSRVWSRAFWRRPVTELSAEVEVPAGEREFVSAESIPVIEPDRLRELQGQADQPVPRGLFIPTASLVAVSCAFTLAAGPLYGVTDRAASDLLSRTPYVHAVFPAGCGEGSACRG